MDEFKEFSKNGTPENGRFQAFKPGGPYAKILASSPIAIVLNDTLFVHAGLSKHFLSYGIEKLNKEAHLFLRGELKDPPPFIDDSDGPLWTRRYTNNPSQEVCRELQQVLKQLNCTRMVVGHTIQPEGISSTCADMCWMIDTGMAFSQAKIEVLEISPSKIRILPEKICR